MALTDRFTIAWRLAGGNMTFLRQFDETILRVVVNTLLRQKRIQKDLQSDHATLWREA